jgi:hypothetical protein
MACLFLVPRKIVGESLRKGAAFEYDALRCHNRATLASQVAQVARKLHDWRPGWASRTAEPILKVPPGLTKTFCDADGNETKHLNSVWRTHQRPIPPRLPRVFEENIAPSFHQLVVSVDKPLRLHFQKKTQGVIH